MKKNYSRRDALKIFGAGAIIAGVEQAYLLQKQKPNHLISRPKSLSLVGDLEA